MDKNQLGIQLMQEGKWEEAAKIFMEVIERDPKDAVAYINFGNVLSAVGDPERALKFFEKAIQLDGGGAAYYSAGALLYEEEQFDEAKKMFDAAIKAGLQTSDNYFMLGMCLIQLQTARLALPYLQRAVELNPTDAEALFQCGLCLAQEGLLDEAINQLLTCVEIDSNHADAHYNLGVAYAFKENQTQALFHLEKAIEIQPDHSLAVNTKAVLTGTNSDVN